MCWHKGPGCPEAGAREQHGCENKALLPQHPGRLPPRSHLGLSRRVQRENGTPAALPVPTCLSWCPPVCLALRVWHSPGSRHHTSLTRPQGHGEGVP